MTDRPASQLLKDQLTPTAQLRLEELRAELGIAENDALWALLLGLERYLALFQACPAQVRKEMRATLREHEIRRTDALRVSTVLGAAAALATLFGALCMHVGARTARSAPVWLEPVVPTASGLQRAMLSALAAPAGWMAFALLLPLAAWVTVHGARSAFRDPSPWPGSLIGCGAFVAFAASATALWYLL